ncbi:MAG: glycoside-pentoside-hexuronide (GPH):cation symporter [Pseudomonadota bacterium]
MSNYGPNSSAQLRLGQKAGFGIGDFGLSAYYNGLNLLLLYYYTDVLGIRPALAGSIFAVALVWDALTDPAMGVIASRTVSRFGRLRPYLLFGAIPLALSFVGLFAAPLIFPTAIAMASLVAHLLFRTLFTVVAVPYAALTANLTSVSKDRSSLTSYRMTFSMIGALAVTSSMIPLAEALSPDDQKVGYLYASSIFATAGVVTIWTTFVTTQERVETSPPPPLTFRMIGRQLGSNRSLTTLLAAIAATAMASSIFSKAIIYYVESVPPFEVTVSASLTTLTGALAGSIPFWGLGLTRFEKRTVWLSGSAMVLAASIVLFLWPPQQLMVFLIMVGCIGAGFGSYIVSSWSMLPDTVEVGEWHARARDEGMIYGINQFVLKASTAIGIALLGFGLELIGYQANIQPSVQTIEILPIVTMVAPAISVGDRRKRFYRTALHIGTARTGLRR